MYGNKRVKVTCDACGGTGDITFSDGDWGHCPICDGSGKMAHMFAVCPRMFRTVAVDDLVKYLGIPDEYFDLTNITFGDPSVAMTLVTVDQFVYDVAQAGFPIEEPMALALKATFDYVDFENAMS